MTNDIVAIQRRLEDIKQQTDEMEFWYARDLMELLEYSRWESFEPVIRKAMMACKQLGISPDDHFRQVPKMVTIGSGAQRVVIDVMLTSCSCQLMACLLNAPNQNAGVWPCQAGHQPN